MVIDIIKIPRNGVYEWIFQRITNVLVLIYGLLVANYFLSEDVDHTAVVAFFSQGWFMAFSVLVLAFGCLNSVLAGWQIAGDYINKNPKLNKVFMRVCVIVTALYFLFGLVVLV